MEFTRRAAEKVKDTVIQFDRRIRTPPPPRGRWFGVNTGEMDIRSFMLRTDLAEGGTAIAQWIEFKSFGICDDEGSPRTQYEVCWHLDGEGDPVFFWVFDRHREFHGTADQSGGIAWILTDTPTFDQLCLEEHELFPGVTEVLEIQRMVCPDFTGCPCTDPDVDPCNEGS